MSTWRIPFSCDYTVWTKIFLFCPSKVYWVFTLLTGFFCLFVFKLFGVFISFQYQISTQLWRSWHCTWPRVGRGGYPYAIVSGETILVYIVMSCFPQSENWLLNNWYTLIGSDQWDFFKFNFNQYVRPDHWLGTVLCTSKLLVPVTLSHNVECIFLQPTCSSNRSRARKCELLFQERLVP